jgi:hypothetical protein
MSHSHPHLEVPKVTPIPRDGMARCVMGFTYGAAGQVATVRAGTRIRASDPLVVKNQIYFVDDSLDDREVRAEFLRRWPNIPLHHP